MCYCPSRYVSILRVFSLLLLLVTGPAVLCGGAHAQQGNAGMVTAHAARTSGDRTAARFVLDVDKPVSFSVFALASPYRLVIDLPSMSFEMEQGMAQVEHGMVEKFRFGTFGNSRSRIVLDMAGPSKVVRAYNLPSVDGNPARVVIELETVSKREFAEQTLRDVIRVKSGDEREGKGTGAVLASRPVPKDEKGGDPRPLVVLDPGHGGIDTGALSIKGLKESDIVLAFAKALKKKLEADGQVRVAMTRDADVFISLSKRVAFAQARKADLFVSIHADTVRESYVRGATVYTLSDKASDAVAERMAQNENKSDLLAGLEIEEKDDVVADILIDLTRRETANYSALYSRTLVGALKSSIKLSKTPERSAGFKVLKAPDIPSVLLELGYLSNDKDQSALISDAWRNKAVESISRSLNKYFSRRAIKSSALFSGGAG